MEQEVSYSDGSSGLATLYLNEAPVARLRFRGLFLCSKIFVYLSSNWRGVERDVRNFAADRSLLVVVAALGPHVLHRECDVSRLLSGGRI